MSRLSDDIIIFIKEGTLADLPYLLEKFIQEDGKTTIYFWKVFYKKIMSLVEKDVDKLLVTDDYEENIRAQLSMINPRKAAELMSVSDMIDDIKNNMSFTESIKRFSARDVLPDGHLSERMYVGVNHVELWKELGGTFSPREEEDLRNNSIVDISLLTSPSEYYTTMRERRAFARKNQSERQAIINSLVQSTSDSPSKFAKLRNRIKQPNPRAYNSI